MTALSGDFNGDGKPDLAVANNGAHDVGVLLGNGDGTFGVKTDYDVGQPAYGVVIADLNSDGNLDIVAETAFSLTEGVSVYPWKWQREFSDSRRLFVFGFGTT